MIKPDTCPYCGAPYKIVFAGCRDKCRDSERAKALIREVAEMEISEEEEILYGYAKPSRADES